MPDDNILEVAEYPEEEEEMGEPCEPIGFIQPKNPLPPVEFDD